MLLAFQQSVRVVKPLYVIPEEGREYYRSSYHEQAGTAERLYVLGYLTLTILHLDVYLQGGNNHHDARYRIAYVQDLCHHSHRKVMGSCEGIGSPGVIHAAALRRSVRYMDYGPRPKVCV